MRKWLTLLLITTLVLTACGKSNEKASLEKSIDQLKKENKDLKKQKKKLQEQKDKLKHKQDSLQEDVNELPAKSEIRKIKIIMMQKKSLQIINRHLLIMMIKLTK